ncbi:hypothetical protein [Xanthomonas massiliensis]|jgi:hypothetical protein|uniref:hypothetical protein n=1 Tax=Xanthomonas massiliensis TaxID=1720302 RepID=UPI0008254A8C|nr:hypothetical protein [Xanthomonas massiliensis]
MNSANTPHDNDAVLLEGLYQLAIHGRTDGQEFQQLDNVVYARLEATYGIESGHGEQQRAA